MASNTMPQHNFTSEDINELSCPICFRTATDDTNATVRSNQSGSNIDYVYSSTCGHVFCLPCIEKILLASSNSYENRTREMQSLQADEQFVTTTQGACPMCRAELSYFDIMKVSFMKAEDDTCSALTKSKDLVVSSDPIPIQLQDAKFQSDDDSYIQFPSDMNDSTTKGATLYTTYFKEFVPTGVLELTGYIYLAHTKTFKARAKKIATIHDTEFTVWLHFSDNFQCITHGACRKVDTMKFHEDVAGESYPKRQTEDKVFIYPFSESSRTLMCRVTPPKISLSVPPLIPNTFWGNIYCQQFLVGFGSYHFVKKPNSDGSDGDDGAVAYMSYEHKMSVAWPPLDNGRPLPSRVFFRNISCPDQYIFRGSICWYDDFQTTWSGCSRWDYEIKFDTAFFCILTGTVQSVIMNHDNEDASEAKVATFGVDLDYINAGIGNLVIRPLASTIIGASHSSFEKLVALSLLRSRMDVVFNQIHERLQFEGVTLSTLSRLLYVLRLGSKNTITKLFEYCQRNPSEQVGDIKLDYHPIDLDYYFE